MLRFEQYMHDSQLLFHSNAASNGTAGLLQEVANSVARADSRLPHGHKNLRQELGALHHSRVRNAAKEKHFQERRTSNNSEWWPRRETVHELLAAQNHKFPSGYVDLLDTWFWYCDKQVESGYKCLIIY